MTNAIDRAALDYLWHDSSVLALVLDADGGVVEANARSVALLGSSLVGRPFASLTAVDGGDLRSGGLVHLLLPGGHMETMRMTRVDLDRGALMLGESDAGERALLQREIAALTDELQNLSRELARKNEELRRLDALKNRFLGMAAHDLRKPAGAVLAYAELLIDEAGGRLEEEHRHFLDVIHSSCAFMSRLIDDFLDLAVIESGRLVLHRASIEPGGIVAASMTIAEVQARLKGVTCDVDAPRLPPMPLDGPKMEQVVTNIVGNAIEHSTRGAHVRVASRIEGGAWVITISDQGAGMEPAELERLFRPFESGRHAKTAGERSTGLGLAISKMIVDAHGGSITAAGSPGAGTTFTVRIPAADGGTT
jgi:signal transduction histidine kinase